MEELDGAEIIFFPDAAAWENWLAANYGRETGVWLKLAKKGSGLPTVGNDDIVDTGLCYGWISGQRRSLDQQYFLQKYVPRRPGSLWSQVNVDKVAALLAEGRMCEPGMAEVRAAQADGRWDAAYPSQKDATVPPDLVGALAENSAAEAYFRSLPRSEQYQLYLPVLQALRPEIRAARIDRLVARLAAAADNPPR